MSEEAARNLSQHCIDAGLSINPAIEAQYVEGAGLSIYTTRKLKEGERVIHIPIKHLLTTANIPQSFLSTAQRDGVAVHAQLAAFLAFGDADDLQQYEAWAATWPALDTFVEGMPIFWGRWSDDLLQRLGRSVSAEDDSLPKAKGGHASKKRKLSSGEKIASKSQSHKKKMSPKNLKSPTTVFLSPALTGWHPDDAADDTLLLPKMIEKLATHIKSIAAIKPELDLIFNDDNLAKFLHKWCIVNTRCFYYVPASGPGTKKTRQTPKPPSDPNEAMALIPFIDLFNHASPPPNPLSSAATTTNPAATPCKVRSSATSFEVTTARAHPPGAELLLSYGPHTNDTLWSEYGFLLPSSTNTCDSIPLDSLVLSVPPLTDYPRNFAALDKHGYLGTYTLHHDGSFCYRTEMVVWLYVHGRATWSKLVAQGLDPAAADTTPSDRGRFIGMMVAIIGWMQDIAAGQIGLLEGMGVVEAEEVFETIKILKGRWSVETERETVQKRKRMCLERWRQISVMVQKALEDLAEQSRLETEKELAEKASRKR